MDALAKGACSYFAELRKGIKRDSEGASAGQNVNGHLTNRGDLMPKITVPLVQSHCPEGAA